MNYRNAGGTDGGTMQFLLGFIMLTGGLYLLLSEMIIRPNIGFGARIFSFGGYSMTTGMVFIPFMFGIGMVFYNGKSIIGWALTLGSMIALIFGVISNLNIQLSRMSAFDLIVILVLLVGGLGLLLRSLLPHKTE
ncbi:MAG: hypothetical protein AAGK67_08665 [Pseudomonadota bacterium]